MWERARQIEAEREERVAADLAEHAKELQMPSETNVAAAVRFPQPLTYQLIFLEEKVSFSLTTYFIYGLHGVLCPTIHAGHVADTQSLSLDGSPTP